MATTNYDYAIIGAGAAGLNLALTMANDPFFASKSIIILDPDKKESNDKTWCFWDKDITPFDSIIAKKWEKAVFTTREGNTHTLALKPFSYQMVHAIDFYSYAKKELSKHPNMDWLQGSVESIDEKNKIITSLDHYTIHEHIFDSRISKEFEHDTSSIKLLQHFKGWIVETEEDHFDDSAFVMMDFSLRWNDTTSFTYILPYSPRKALIEFTFFSPELVNEEDYDQMIQKYLKDHLKIDNYVVADTEKGVIPMSDFAFHKDNTNNITKIGTAGSWVKPSSGYSFRNAIRLSKQVVKNIKDGQLPSKGLLSSKYRFYDALFLDVLHSKNHIGPDIFGSMYKKNKVQQILKFLNEDTSFLEEVKIMSTFPMAPFNHALIKWLFR